MTAPPETAPRSSGGMLVVGALILVMGAAGAGYWFWRGSDHSPAIPTAETPGMSPRVVERITQYRNRLLADPRSAQAWGEYGMCLFQHERLRDALICFEEAVALDPRSPRWPYYAGLICEQIDYGRARHWYEKALANDRRYAPLVLRLAGVMSQSGDAAGAERLLLELQKDSPRVIASYVELSRLARKRNDAASAREIVETALSRGLQSRELLTERALAANLVGDREVASEAMAQAQLLPAGGSAPADPWMGDVLATDASGTMESARADALRSQGPTPAAEAALAALAEAHPERSRPALNHAALLLEQGRTDEARAELQTLLTDFPDDPLIHLTLARAWMQGGDPRQAEQSLRTALERKPDLAEAQYALGRLLETQERPDEAENCYRRATAAAPADPSAYQALAELLLRTQRTAEALDVVRKVEALQSADPAVQSWLQEHRQPAPP